MLQRSEKIRWKTKKSSNLFKLFCRSLRIVMVPIRMPLHSSLLVSLFDLCFTGILGYPQQFVVVLIWGHDQVMTLQNLWTKILKLSGKGCTYKWNHPMLKTRNTITIDELWSPLEKAFTRLLSNNNECFDVRTSMLLYRCNSSSLPTEFFCQDSNLTDRFSKIFAYCSQQFPRERSRPGANFVGQELYEKTRNYLQKHTQEIYQVPLTLNFHFSLTTFL